jgi:Flp pilus assembly protein CpaB
MEMEFKDKSRRRKVFVALGLVLSLVAGGAAFFLASQGSTKAAEVPMKTVVVATQQIDARTIIASDMLVERSVPDDPTVEQAVVDPAMLVGRLSGVTIYANQAITPNLLATSAVGAEFSILSATETISPDSPTWRAVAVFVPKDRAVGGNLEIGQRVDLLVTAQVDVLVQDAEGKLVIEPDPVSGYAPGKSTKIGFEDVEILAKDEDADLYTLKVDLHQAEELSHLLASADDTIKISIVLRPDGDNRVIDRSSYGETNNRIIEQYNLPIPMVIDLDAYVQPSSAPAPFVPGQALPSPEVTPDPESAPDVSPAPEASPEAAP